MSRRDVLNAFKSIHRVAQKTFEGDKRALLEARNRINLEFRQETSEVEEKIKRCKEVERILLTQVVQAVKNPETNNYGEICPRYTETVQPANE